jgi:hypothetical protein
MFCNLFHSLFRLCRMSLYSYFSFSSSTPSSECRLVDRLACKRAELRCFAINDIYSCLFRYLEKSNWMTAHRLINITTFRILPDLYSCSSGKCWTSQRENSFSGLQINIWLDRTFVRSLLILVGHNLNLVGQKPTLLNLVGHIYVTRYI